MSRKGLLLVLALLLSLRLPPEPSSDGEPVAAGATAAAPAQPREPTEPTKTAGVVSAAALPAEERAVFELAWFLGAEQVEVAEHLGCSVRTVKRRWETVKHLLRDALGDESPAHG